MRRGRWPAEQKKKKKNGWLLEIELIRSIFAQTADGELDRDVRSSEFEVQFFFKSPLGADP